MYNLLGGMLIAIGNAVAPLLFLIFSSILNVGLDIFFITVLKMGVEGAAIATVIAQALSVSLCLLYIYKKEKILIPKKEHFTHDSELFKDMLGQGMSMGFMSSIVSAGSVILQYGINGLGYLTIAGHTAARKLFMMFNIPFGAMAMSMGTFVSQNMGANRYDRIRKGLKSAYLYDLIMAVFVTIILMVFSRDLVKLISGSSDPIVLENGSLYLKVVGPFYAVLGILLQTRVALQGLGLKLLPLISSIIEFFGKILFVLFFIPKFQYLAVIFCEPLIWIVMTIQLVYTFYNHSKIKEAKKAWWKFTRL